MSKAQILGLWLLKTTYTSYRTDTNDRLLYVNCIITQVISYVLEKQLSSEVLP